MLFSRFLRECFKKGLRLALGKQRWAVKWYVVLVFTHSYIKWSLPLWKNLPLKGKDTQFVTHFCTYLFIAIPKYTNRTEFPAHTNPLTNVRTHTHTDKQPVNVRSTTFYLNIQINFNFCVQVKWKNNRKSSIYLSVLLGSFVFVCHSGICLMPSWVWHFHSPPSTGTGWRVIKCSLLITAKRPFKSKRKWEYRHYKFIYFDLNINPLTGFARMFFVSVDVCASVWCCHIYGFSSDLTL